MKARLSIEYITNEISDFCSNDLIELNLQCPINKGETFYFTQHGYEWMGQCTNVHHLFGSLIEYGNSHLPVFKLIAHAVRKIPT
jgi:hypothetical protein